MLHKDFLDKLDSLKAEAEEAFDSYLYHLEEQKKAKFHRALIRSQIKDFKQHYDNNKFKGE